MRRRSRLLLWLVLLVLAAWEPARAEPYLAVQTGAKCVACHVNPTGGGLRNAAGVVYAQRVLPAHQWPESWPDWGGSLGERLRVGGDLRTGSVRTTVPGQAPQQVGGLKQFRIYADFELVAQSLAVYVDETVAPGTAARQEAYVRAAVPGTGWYAKAGQFYLPFGWRLQDNSAIVRQLSGISMTAPDKGLELGLELDGWSAQWTYTGGAANVGTVSGRQMSGQIVSLRDWGRVGVAALSTRSTSGDRQAVGIFGGTRTGPLAWLFEVDLVRDAGFPEGRRNLAATLAEVNWRVAQGHNLKLSAELLDPDRRIQHDHKLRQSVVYEYSPLPYLQLRAGWRRHLGIPQNNFDNRQQKFIELHGLF